MTIGTKSVLFGAHRFSCIHGIPGVAVAFGQLEAVSAASIYRIRIKLVYVHGVSEFRADLPQKEQQNKGKP